MRYYATQEDWQASTDDVLVYVTSDEGEWYCGFTDTAVAPSAESACATVWIDHGLRCSSLDAVVEWSSGETFGPFVVSISVTGTVDNPRQGDLA